MPRAAGRPPASGYERLAQQEELSDTDDDDSLLGNSGQPHSTSIHTVARSPSPPRNGRSKGPALKRSRSSTSGVDIKAINARLELWADQIAAKFKYRGRSRQERASLEIAYSVFSAPEGYHPTDDRSPLDSPVVPESAQFTHEQFVEVVAAVRRAISKGIDPKLITQGSSGTYFMRDSNGDVVGIMKPKDEESYGKLNPKLMKWLHRTLFPCFFGRACLIPNLSYISEAAACTLDRQLRTFIVPYTDIVELSSKAFHYDYWDRRTYYRRRKPLPKKIGSFQVFLKGYQDANIFLKNHPWPDAAYAASSAPRRRRPWSSYAGYGCGPVNTDTEGSSYDEAETPPLSAGDPPEQKFVWTEQLQQNFREELEKLVILDYIMRNTDRGLDNWMVKVDWETQEVSIASRPPNLNLDVPSQSSSRPASPLYKVQEPMVASSRSATPSQAHAATISLGAIDNSLAFPWKHPDQWRSFPFGWLFLPVSLIGQPFSKKTREHFIPLLTSKRWWSETQTLLRRQFEKDSDFKERMFQKQMAVLKGQAFNVLETLKTSDQGPLELTRRPRVHVWDDEMEVPVAVPLRVPSSESQRLRGTDRAASLDAEEMDIGVSSAPVPREYDLLGLSPPRSELPSFVRSLIHDGRSQRFDGAANNESSGQSTFSGSTQEQSGNSSLRQPSGYSPRPSHRAHMSYDFGGSQRRGSGGRPRGFSHTMSTGQARYVYNDEAEGDLGYSALGESDNARRKVIVERLEPVKARNPVFTWC